MGLLSVGALRTVCRQPPQREISMLRASQSNSEARFEISDPENAKAELLAAGPRPDREIGYFGGTCGGVFYRTTVGGAL